VPPYRRQPPRPGDGESLLFLAAASLTFPPFHALSWVTFW